MGNANGRRVLEEAKALEHGEVACGLAIAAEALSIELNRVRQQRAELLEACKAAEHNSLDLPEYVVSLLRQAITKAEAAE